MTEDQRVAQENQAFQAAFEAERAVNVQKQKLCLIGQHLIALGQALQDHPEEVTRLPESFSEYDYRVELRTLMDGGMAVELCDELRDLIRKLKSAEKLKGMVVHGPFGSQT